MWDIYVLVISLFAIHLTAFFLACTSTGRKICNMRLLIIVSFIILGGFAFTLFNQPVQLHRHIIEKIHNNNYLLDRIVEKREILEMQTRQICELFLFTDLVEHANKNPPLYHTCRHIVLGIPDMNNNEMGEAKEAFLKKLERYKDAQPD